MLAPMAEADVMKMLLLETLEPEQAALFKQNYSSKAVAAGPNNNHVHHLADGRLIVDTLVPRPTHW